jgi:hypothetical protein
MKLVGKEHIGLLKGIVPAGLLNGIIPGLISSKKLVFFMSRFTRVLLKEEKGFIRFT